MTYQEHLIEFGPAGKRFWRKVWYARLWSALGVEDLPLLSGLTHPWCADEPSLLPDRRAGSVHQPRARSLAALA
jgi:hypothetical protein